MAKTVSILVVDDNPDTREVIKRNLSQAGYRVVSAPDVKRAVKLLAIEPVELVITDFKMPEINGLDLVRHVRENLKHTVVMMITGYASVQGAVNAVKGGAEEYLAKPFTDDELFSAVKRSLAKLKARKEAQPPSQEKAFNAYGLTGQSKAMREVFSMIEKTAASFGTVLITGESGTGKELVARAIHYCSQRKAAPFVPINCGAIPENLFEGELFGYMKGAFTGAAESRAGFLQTAEGGSIFLDEVSEMTPGAQVKFLRVLQENEIYLLGGRKPQKLDVRVIAASNKDLESLVKKDAFREDLYYRLNVITINIPPLRERRDDILLLVSHFAEKYSRQLGRNKPQFTDKALEILENYYWPGNVRELENMIQRILVLSDACLIDVPDLPEFLRFNAGKRESFNRPLAEIEAEYIQNVLESAGGNRTRAAQILRIDRKTLREKLKSVEQH